MMRINTSDVDSDEFDISPNSYLHEPLLASSRLHPSSSPSSSIGSSSSNKRYRTFSFPISLRSSVDATMARIRGKSFLALTAPDSSSPPSKLSIYHLRLLRKFRNPRALRQEEGEPTVRIPDSWAFTRLGQIGIGMYFIISFVNHKNHGGSGGIWPTLAVGIASMIYATYMVFLLLRPLYRNYIPNLTLVLCLADLVFAGASLFLCIWMSSYTPYHWHQCQFFWWGRACKLQRYQNAAMFLNFFSFMITAGVSIFTMYRLYAQRKATASTANLPYSRVPTAPDHDRNKYSNVQFSPTSSIRGSSSNKNNNGRDASRQELLRDNGGSRHSSSSDGSASDSQQGRSSLLVPAQRADNIVSDGEGPERTASRVGFRAHDSDSEIEVELNDMDRSRK